MVFKERKTFYSLLEVLELLENILYLVLKQKKKKCYSLHLLVNLLKTFTFSTQVKIHGKMLKNTDKESFEKEDNIEHLSSYFL